MMIVGLLAEAWGTAWRKGETNAIVIALRHGKSPAAKARPGDLVFDLSVS
jgi:hypothetical protein